MKATNRRRFLTLAGLGLLGGALGYVYIKGVRYPRLHFTPPPAPTVAAGDGITIQAHGAVLQETTEDGAFRFRAFAPEPRFELGVESGRRLRLLLENVHPDSTLHADPKQPGLSERHHNLLRTVEVEEAKTNSVWRLGWGFPKPNAYRFTVIGDTGGGLELDWVIKRSVELGADFIVHLGDFYYDPGDLERAAAALNAASIPTFAAIGNHDFRVGWQPLYPHFTRLIGPRNSSFHLGGIQFLNLDTATDFWPADRGERLRLLQQFSTDQPDTTIRDFVVFTHRPLYEVNGWGEASWLRQQLLDRGMRKLMAGHIHIKDEQDDGGLYTYVSGQGLGHADLIVARPIAQILVADVVPEQPVKYRWAPLKMPFEAHCNSRNLGVLEVLKRQQALARLREICITSTAAN